MEGGVEGRGEESALMGGEGVWRRQSAARIKWFQEGLTTQTPATAYLPSAALRSMILALFWDRSTLAFSGAGSAMVALDGTEGWAVADPVVCDGSENEVVRCQLDLVGYFCDIPVQEAVDAMDAYCSFTA